MVSAIRRGDKIVTAGGLIGTVTKIISDTEAQVELAEGVRVRVVRHTISEVLTRTEARDGEPRPANDAGSEKPKSLLHSLLGLGGKRSEEHTSELQSLMRSSYAVFCLKKKKNKSYELTNNSTR